jgi:predicted aldo/keto reductase-like oxidoreductase
MIPLMEFGNTKHNSTRTIFGGAAFWSVTQDEANETLDLLLEYGVNHIDTAASYGDSELRIGPWMKEHRKTFFLATKTEKRTYLEAKEELYKSLDRLKVDYVDLWQMHNLVNPDQWETAQNDGGTIDAFIEAKEEGLVRFVGVTGHGLAAPRRHLQSLEQYKFNSVLLPYNFIMMKDEKYASDFAKLEKYCVENKVAIQTIKTISKGPLGDKKSKHAVWYDPLDNPQSIANAVNWSFGNPNIFISTVGDVQLLKHLLQAAANFDSRPSDEEMQEDIEKYGITPLFKGEEI